jgi:murein DD-endopeptidase MepM/ murein hydrolase activator NlpD
MTAIPGYVDPMGSLGQKMERLSSQLSTAEKSSSEQRLRELKDAADQFEAVLTGYLLKVMRSTIDKAEEEDGATGFGKDVYMEMFDNEVALGIARTHGLGIAEMIYRQLEERVLGEKNSEGKVEKVGADSPPRRQGALFLPIDSSGGIEANKQEREENISSSFGPRRDPSTHRLSMHRGVDIVAPDGSPIKAAASGRVVFSGFLGSYGNAMIVEHQDGYRTLYGHASANLVQLGESVEEGQTIGLVGNTGRSAGPHLHFELQKDGIRVDPALHAELKLASLAR